MHSPHSGLLLSPLPGHMDWVPSHPSCHTGRSFWVALESCSSCGLPRPSYLVVCGLRAWLASGSSAELGSNLTWAAPSQMPVRTGFIQFWSGLLAQGEPSGLWRQLCSLGALPAGASSRGKPQRLLETASWGYTHAHTQAHSVCAHTHRHGAHMTRDTCVFTDADTFRATRDPGFVERPGGQGAASDVPQTGPFRKACPQFRDQAARLRPGRGSHGLA